MALDKHSLSHDAVVASGGWCAPLDAVYDAQLLGLEMGTLLRLDDTFPAVAVQRGGIDFIDRRTDDEKDAAVAMQAFIARKVGDILKAQDAVINRACIHAMANDWDVHVYRHPYHQTRFIGIGLTPQEHIIPTIHEHRSDYSHEWDEDDD